MFCILLMKIKKKRVGCISVRQLISRCIFLNPRNCWVCPLLESRSSISWYLWLQLLSTEIVCEKTKLNNS